MNDKEMTSNLWLDVSAKAETIPGGTRLAEKLKSMCGEAEYTGDPVCLLTNGNLYEKALELLLSDLELMRSREQLLRLEEKRELKEREFWLHVYDESGLSADDRLSFDPFTGWIRKRKPMADEPPDSYKATLDRFKELIELALTDPVSAGRMSKDDALPTWLREMASAILADNLKPHLRRVIGDCVEDPPAARRWVLAAEDSAMPGWFVQMARVMGTRKKWML